MGLWHVFYADWQMECCGTPFSVGDEVSWPLLLLDSGDLLGGGWHDQLTKVSGPLERVDGVRVVTDESGLTVALAADDDGDDDGADDGDDDGPAPGDWIRAVGMLSVERHGARWPQVRGHVRLVQVLTQGFAASSPGSRTLEPVAHERWLRPVPRCPKWFTGRAAQGGAGDRRGTDAGVVVTLEVPRTDSWLSYAVREARGIPQRGAVPGAETRGMTAGELAALLETLSTVPPVPERP